MLNKYKVNVLEGGEDGRRCFSVHADTIDGAAIRAGYELQQVEPAQEIRMIETYAFIA